MILGIGVDLVLIERFEPWLTFSTQKLGRIFHAYELELYQKHDQKKVFLASRFAVKEAFFKALSAALVSIGSERRVSFLSIAPQLYVGYSFGVPKICIEEPIWSFLHLYGLRMQLSLSHEKTMAIAYVIIDQ